MMTIWWAAAVAKAAFAGATCGGPAVTAKIEGDALVVETRAMTPGDRKGAVVRQACNGAVTVTHGAPVELAPQSAKVLARSAAPLELTLKLHYQGRSETMTGKATVTGAGKVTAHELALDGKAWSPCGKETTLVVSLAAVQRPAPGTTADYVVEGPLTIPLRVRPCGKDGSTESPSGT